MMSLFLAYPVYGTFCSIVLIFLFLRSIGWTDTRCRLSSFLLASPYFVFSLPRIFVSPPVVDELRFVRIAQDFGLHEYSLIQMLYAPNLEGFGGLWWTFEAVSFRVWNSVSPDSSTFSTIATLRLLTILCVTLWLSGLFGLTMKSSGVQKFIPLLVAATPMVWWSGKLASPELVSASLVGMGVFLLVREKFLASSVLLGLALGFKISAIAPVIAIVVYVIVVQNKKFSLLDSLPKVRFFGTLIITFFASNFYFFTNPGSFFRLSSRVNPVIAGQLPSLSVQEIVEKVFVQDEMHWDFVSRNGFIYWIGGFFSVVFVIVLLVASSNNTFKYLSIFSLIIVIGSLLVGNGLDFPWYYFPTISLILTLLASDRSGFKASLYKINYLSRFTLVLALTSGLIYSSQENSQVSNNIRDSHEFAVQKACIKKQITTLRSDMKVYSMIFPEEEIALDGIAQNSWEASLWLTNPQDEKVLLAVGARGKAALQRVENIELQLMSRCGHYNFYVGQRKFA
jgi:hypothetical protein